jgi:hypothetical protein
MAVYALLIDTLMLPINAPAILTDGLEVAARVHDRDVHRLPDLYRLRFGGGDHLSCVFQRYALHAPPLS